jgi:hypothetical protein
MAMRIFFNIIGLQVETLLIVYLLFGTSKF